jgi:flavodoxin
VKALVLFESAFGNTERIAKAIVRQLEGFGQVTLLHAAEAGSVSLLEFDLLVIGSPTQFRKASPTVTGWLDGLGIESLKGKFCAIYDTRYQMPAWKSGSAGKLLAKRVRRLGGVLLLEPESYFVGRNAGDLLPGEIERVPAWVDGLYQKYVSHSEITK